MLFIFKIRQNKDNLVKMSKKTTTQLIFMSSQNLAYSLFQSFYRKIKKNYCWPTGHALVTQESSNIF